MPESVLKTNWLLRKLRRALQLYGPSSAKRSLWNHEFSKGHWDCLTETAGDPVYPIIERYAANRSILDLGCGSGSTVTELAPKSYRDYTGVDISDAAIVMAAKRAEENGCAGKASFLQGDIESYIPAKEYAVILFRDSIYYLPEARIKAMLDRYTRYVEPSGVFVVRMSNIGYKANAILNTVESNFQVVEKRQFYDPWTAVIVFR